MVQASTLSQLTGQSLTTGVKSHQWLGLIHSSSLGSRIGPPSWIEISPPTVTDGPFPSPTCIHKEVGVGREEAEGGVSVPPAELRFNLTAGELGSHAYITVNTSKAEDIISPG